MEDSGFGHSWIKKLHLNDEFIRCSAAGVKQMRGVGPVVATKFLTVRKA